jgi:hypothetical protein
LTLMNVELLIGSELDYAVAVALGDVAEILVDERGPFCLRTVSMPRGGYKRGPFAPSSSPIDGDKLIDEFRISTSAALGADLWAAMAVPAAYQYQGGGYSFAFPSGHELDLIVATTRLVAAMRALVISRIGTTVEIPEARVLRINDGHHQD